MSPQPRGTEAPTLSLLAFDDEFDPLAVDDTEIDQEWMDDDNPYDTIDYPTMRNMPETNGHAPVYTPERQGSAKEALRAMVRQNPGRRPVLLGIVGLCEGGCPSSKVSEAVEAWQKDNRSVYAPMTLCRMLERAGALTLEMPETTEEQHDDQEGVTYLEIKERVDPIWHATPEALELRAEYEGGAEFRRLVLGEDARYVDVYEAVMERVRQAPCGEPDIDALTSGFEITQKPRRFGQHFIDVLEMSDCLVWNGSAWALTDLGAALLDELKASKGEN
ncbi:MAG: hypothetical protein HFJ75_03090 [Eggerthellaceae bacterium]|nr:hypothetical protein [Eggerthellaceae bacterium]